MKNYKNYKEGEKVKILFSHSDDLGCIGLIKEVRNSFCKILILNDDGTPKLNKQNNKPIIKNHTYNQFKKV